MNPEIKERWLKALRSGEYKQARKQLRFHDHYCCLGVLCDLHSKETGTQWHRGSYPHKTGDPDLTYHTITYMKMEGLLPEEVSAWAGISDSDPKISRGEQSVKLSKLNDDGASFTEIAELIEECL